MLAQWAEAVGSGWAGLSPSRRRTVRQRGMRNALCREMEKELIIPLPHPVRPEDIDTVRTASIIEKMVWEDVSAVSQDFLPLPAGRKKSYICNVGLPRGKPSTDGDP